MTNQQHPITPPPELVEQWRAAASNVPASLSTDPGGRRDYIDFIANRAAQWGSDQELEACVKWIEDCGYHPSVPENFRAARRPKPPSLKEQALEKLMNLEQGINPPGFNDYNTIRRALEALRND
jgi:hypothetical protein